MPPASCGKLTTASITPGGLLVAQIFSHWPHTAATGPKLAIATSVVIALMGAACSFARLRLDR